MGYSSLDDWINKATVLDQIDSFTWLKLGAAAEAAGVWQSLWYAQGCPGIPGHPAAVATPGTALAGTAAAPIPGAICYANQSPATKHILTLGCSPTVDGTLVLYDRLYSCHLSLTTTGAQNIDPSVTQAITRYATGRGVECWLEITTTTGSPTITSVSYTNELGVAGRTGLITLAATPVAGSMYQMRLQTGDLGVRSVQTVTVGTGSGGAAAAGTITSVAGSLLTDADFFTVSDGFQSLVFEFDSNASVTAGRIAVPYTGADANTVTAASIRTVMNGLGESFRITASAGAGAISNLANDLAGTHGNVSITENVANAGFTVTGMSTGTAAANANLLLVRPLFIIPAASNHWVEPDGINRLHALDHVFDGAVMAFKYLATATTATTYYGQIRLGWG